MRRVAVLGIVVVLVGLLGWAGVHQLRARRAAMQKMQESQVTLIPAAPAGSEQPAEAVLTGKDAPGFTLVDLSGKKVSLKDYKGKPVLVNFWATWCVPCREEMPWLEEFSKSYAGQGLTVLGIVTDSPGKDAVQKAAQKSGVTYPVLISDDDTENAYGGVDQLPMSFYVGRDGKVAVQTAGIPAVGGRELIESNIKKIVGGM